MSLTKKILIGVAGTLVGGGLIGYTVMKNIIEAKRHEDVMNGIHGNAGASRSQQQSASSTAS